MLVGNKCDLVSKKVVNTDDAKQYAETLGIHLSSNIHNISKIYAHTLAIHLSSNIM